MTPNKDSEEKDLDRLLTASLLIVLAVAVGACGLVWALIKVAVGALGGMFAHGR